MDRYLTPKANIFVFESTGRWTAAIARKLPDAKVTRSLSLSQLEVDCRENEFSAAVIEILLSRTETEAKDTISATKIYESVFAGRPSKSTRFFAAIDGGAGDTNSELQISPIQNGSIRNSLIRNSLIRNSLIQLGFTATVNGIGEISRLQTMLQRHFETTNIPRQSIEKLVNECLPW